MANTEVQGRVDEFLKLLETKNVSRKEDEEAASLAALRLAYCCSGMTSDEFLAAFAKGGLNRDANRAKEVVKSVKGAARFHRCRKKKNIKAVKFRAYAYLYCRNLDLDCFPEDEVYVLFGVQEMHDMSGKVVLRHLLDEAGEFGKVAQNLGETAFNNDGEVTSKLRLDPRKLGKELGAIHPQNPTSGGRVGEPEGPTDHAGDRATESQICVDETRHGAQNKAATAEGEGSAVEKTCNAPQQKESRAWKLFIDVHQRGMNDGTCDASVTFPGEQDALILHIECKTVTVAERATTPPKLQNKKEGVDLLGQYFTTIYFCVCAEKENLVRLREFKSLASTIFLAEASLLSEQKNLIANESVIKRKAQRGAYCRIWFAEKDGPQTSHTSLTSSMATELTPRAYSSTFKRGDGSRDDFSEGILFVINGVKDLHGHKKSKECINDFHEWVKARRELGEYVAAARDYTEKTGDTLGMRKTWVRVVVKGILKLKGNSMDGLEGDSMDGLEGNSMDGLEGNSMDEELKREIRFCRYMLHLVGNNVFREVAVAVAEEAAKTADFQTTDGVGNLGDVKAALAEPLKKFLALKMMEAETQAQE